MSDFDISNIQDEDQVEITDLEPQDDGSSASLSFVLLKFTRKAPLFANTRARSTTLALLACVFMLLFLVQPGLPSMQALRTRVPFQSSPLPGQSPLFIVDGSSVKQITWIKVSNGVEIVRQAPAGVMVWHHCKLLNWHVPQKYQRPIIFICK
jgi:hypothetical protein